MDVIDPHAIPSFIDMTGWTQIENLEEYRLAKQLAEGIREAFGQVAEKPRWAAWYDQVSRSSQSVLLNFAEAMGRGKGWYSNSLMIARGELAETAASLSIGPREVCDPLKPVATRLYKLLGERIVQTPGK